MMLKHILLIAVLILFAVPTAFADKDIQASKSQPAVLKNCHDTANTQADMNDCADQDLEKVEAELNRVIDKIKKQHSGNPKTIEKFIKAQKAWEEFKKAQLDLLYYDRKGSVSPMCYGNDAANLTRLRVEQLKEWSSPVEGDVCGWCTFEGCYNDSK